MRPLRTKANDQFQLRTRVRLSANMIKTLKNVNSWSECLRIISGNLLSEDLLISLSKQGGIVYEPNLLHTIPVHAQQYKEEKKLRRGPKLTKELQIVIFLVWGTRHKISRESLWSRMWWGRNNLESWIPHAALDWGGRRWRITPSNIQTITQVFLFAQYSKNTNRL